MGGLYEVKAYERGRAAAVVCRRGGREGAARRKGSERSGDPEKW